MRHLFFHLRHGHLHHHGEQGGHFHGACREEAFGHSAFAHHPAHEWHAHGRHRGGFGGGRPGMPGEPGMEGFGLGRKLRSADLQLLILAMLAEAPRHGYELIKAIDERSRGYYVPSPGMIYPALSYLDEVGHARADTEGTKKRYSLTEEGQAFLQERRAEVDALIEQLAQMGERMERARQAWSGEGEGDEEGAAAMGFFGRMRGRRHLHGELHEAFHALKHAVRDSLTSGAVEPRRIAEILKAAAAEIAALGKKGGE